MLELSLNYRQGPTHLRLVSQKENISEKYLGQIVIPLKSAGLLESIRGAQGGYELTRAPREISVAEIVEVLEGNLTPVDIDDTMDCNQGNICATSEVWKKLNTAIEETLRGICLEDIRKIYLQKTLAGHSYDI